MASASQAPAWVKASAFYREYHGHRTEHLAAVTEILRAQHEGIVFFAGDSSLDNKFWLLDQAEWQPACNGYEAVLQGPGMIPDVAYWLNYELLEAKVRYAAVNCSIEESTVRDRQSGLRPQDEFIRDNVTANDVIIMSVGGNDIALRPTLGTIFNTAWLVFASRQSNIEDGSAWGLQHFINLFRLQVLHFVRELTAKTKPKAVVICMIYFLDQNQGPDNRGWADGVLSKLGYFKNPRKLQALIRKVYALATESLRDNDLGVQIIPFPLFEVLDGTNSADYVQKVEPSSQGGRKMAQAFLKTLGDHKLV